MKVVSKKYVVYIFITLFTVFALEIYISLSETFNNLKEVKVQLQRTLHQLKKEKEDIVKLKKTVKKIGAEPLNREEALIKVLKKTDYFVNMYDATVIKSLSEKDNVFFITLSFDYYPESSEDLINFLNKLLEQVSPQLIIDNFRLDNLKEGTKTYFEITLKQPFKGEG